MGAYDELQVKDCTWFTPASCKAFANRMSIDGRKLFPFLHTFGDIIYGKSPVVTSIAILLYSGSPSNITGFVMSIVIRETIKRILSGRTMSNFFQKFFKRSETEFDATFAIICKCDIIWIFTALFSRSKNCIFWDQYSTNSRPMRQIVTSGNFTAPAPTRFLFIQGQVRATNQHNLVACTLTQPHSLSVASSSVSQYRQAIKSLSSQINKIWVNGFLCVRNLGKLKISHVVFSLIENNVIRIGQRLLSFPGLLPLYHEPSNVL